MGCTAKGDLFYGLSAEISDIYTAKIDPNTGQILTPPKKKILHYEGHNYYPDYSPDGKKLAYMFLRGGLPIQQNTLCIVSLETGEKKELNPSLRQFGWPRWSPDGNSISLEGFEEEGQWGIFRIDVQTGEYVPVVVCENEDEIYSHRWSKDGKAIFYTRGNRRSKTFFIFVHDFETGQDSKLAGTPSDATDIDISPDGKFLVLLNREDKRVLRTIPTAGGEPRELHSFEQDGDFVLTPAWTADGRFILFPKKRFFEADQTAQDIKWDMWRISVEGGEPQKLELTMNRFRHLTVHPDGLHLAFSSRGHTFKYPEVWVIENFLPKEKRK
jgi:Tol biopolymer transport system component